MSRFPFTSAKTRSQIGIGVASILSLYVVVAFFVPIVPLTSNVSSLMTSHSYKATWTTVYADGEKVPRATPFNSTLIGGSVLRTPDELYLFGKALPGADPLSTVVVAEITELVGFLHNQIPVYLYDDDNVYIRSNIILPRSDDRPASFVYNEYTQDKFYNSERSSKRYDSSGNLVSHWRNGEKLK